LTIGSNAPIYFLASLVWSTCTNYTPICSYPMLLQTTPD
jgi:hypothetical protein